MTDEEWDEIWEQACREVEAAAEGGFDAYRAVAVAVANGAVQAPTSSTGPPAAAQPREWPPTDPARREWWRQVVCGPGEGWQPPGGRAAWLRECGLEGIDFSWLGEAKSPQPEIEVEPASDMLGEVEPESDMLAEVVPESDTLGEVEPESDMLADWREPEADTLALVEPGSEAPPAPVTPPTTGPRSPTRTFHFYTTGSPRGEDEGVRESDDDSEDSGSSVADAQTPWWAGRDTNFPQITSDPVDRGPLERADPPPPEVDFSMLETVARERRQAWVKRWMKRDVRGKRLRPDSPARPWIPPRIYGRSRSPRPINRRYPWASPSSGSTVQVAIHGIFEVGGAEGPFEMIMEHCVGPMGSPEAAWRQCRSWQSVCKGWHYAFLEYQRDIDD